MLQQDILDVREQVREEFLSLAPAVFVLEQVRPPMVSPCILEHAVDQVELVLGHALASQLLFELEYHVIVLVPY